MYTYKFIFTYVDARIIHTYYILLLCTHIDDLYVKYICLTNTVANPSEIEAKNHITQ